MPPEVYAWVGDVRGAELPPGARRSASSRAPSCTRSTARADGRRGQGSLPLALVAAEAGAAARGARCPRTAKDESPAPALPPMESVTPESDFAPFMHPKVADAVRRVALKKLFARSAFQRARPLRGVLGRLDWRRPDLRGAAQDAEPGAHGALPRGGGAEEEGRRKRRGAAGGRRRKNQRTAMALQGKTLKVCSCNKTVAIDGRALARGAEGGAPIQVHSELCRKDAAAYQAVLGDADVIVACTQEAPLFSEIAEAAGARPALKFVNLREQAGWSGEGAQALPKIAALVALAALPDPEPVPAVSFKSGGQLLIIGPADAGARLGGTPVRDAGSERADHGGARRRVAARAQVPGVVRQGRAPGRLAGRLRGRVDAGRTRSTWRPARAATPASAPVPSRRSTTATRSTWTSARRTAQCVKACGAIGAIDFARAAAPRREGFDLVLDLSREPLIRLPRAAAGLRRAGRGSARAGAGRAGAHRAGGRIRKAALRQLRAAHLRAQPLRAQGLQPLHRRLLERRDHLGRRQGEGRAAHLRRLRRLRHGVPVGRHDLRLLRACRTWARA